MRLTLLFDEKYDHIWKFYGDLIWFIDNFVVAYCFFTTR